MGCSSCRASFDRYFTRYTCETCTNQQKSALEAKGERQLDEAKAQVKAQMELYQPKLKFLCLQFDSEAADATRKGDVVLVIQGRKDETLNAHKFVLTSRSTVFSKMFETGMLEGETGVVHIDDATLPVMQAVIKFCYDADITFTDEVTGEDVLVVAHKYHIALLQKVCEEHLVKTLNNDNLARRLRLAKRFDAPGLETAASTYFKEHFDSVIGSVLTELC